LEETTLSTKESNASEVTSSERITCRWSIPSSSRRFNTWRRLSPSRTILVPLGRITAPSREITSSATVPPKVVSSSIGTR